jgi:hypothetical protein
MNQIQSPYVNFQNPVPDLKQMAMNQLPLKEQEIYSKNGAFASMESILKRSPCYPDTGSSIISWVNNKPKIVVKENSAVHDVGENDISYTFAINNGLAFNPITIPNFNNAAANTRVAGYAIITQYYQYATFNSDIASYTYKYQGSSKSWVDIPDLPTYHRQSAELHNNFRKRTHKERHNFAFDPEYAGFSIFSTNADGTTGGTINYIPTQTYNYNGGLDYSNVILPTYQDIIRPSVIPANIVPTTALNTLVPLVAIPAIPATNANGVIAGDLAAYQNFYGNGNIIQPKSSLNTQTHLIPLTNFVLTNTIAGGASVLSQVPILRKYCYKLKHLVHDSLLNTGQMQYHANEAFHEFSFNPAPNCIVQQNFFVQFSNDNNRVITAVIPCGNIQPYIGTIPLSINNFIMNMYMETNPARVAAMQALKREIIYPFIVDGGGTATTNALNATTTNIPGEFNYRLYRIYGALFVSGQLNSNRPTVYNCENVFANKWDGDLTLSINGDVLTYYNNNTIQADWKTYIQDHFTNSSLISARDIDYHGTFVYDFDTFMKDGTENEYKDNLMKGKILDRNFNLILTFRNAKTYDGTSSYTNKIFYVVLQRAVIVGGLVSYE